MSSSFISTALLVALTLPSLSRAQTCPNQARITALETGYYNASGTVELSWPQAFSSNNADAPWHLSLHVNDTRTHINQGIAPTGWDISMPQPYLSVDRRVRDVSVCVFQFSGRNATATGDSADGSKGCAGVLSNRCTEYIRGKLENTTNSAGRCELPWEKDEEGLRERVEACGEEFNPSTTFASPRIDISQSNCSLPLPPGARNLSATGREYNTFWVGGEYKGGGASPFQDVDWTLRVNDTFTYDLVVTQPVPMLVVASFAKAQPGNPGIIDGLRVEAQMACVTPGDIVAGSRLPGGGVKEGEEGGGEGTGQGGDESAAVRVRVGGLLSVIAAGVVTLMLVW